MLTTTLLRLSLFVLTRVLKLNATEFAEAWWVRGAIARSGNREIDIIEFYEHCQTGRDFKECGSARVHRTLIAFPIRKQKRHGTELL